MRRFRNGLLLLLLLGTNNHQPHRQKKSGSLISTKPIFENKLRFAEYNFIALEFFFFFFFFFCLTFGFSGQNIFSQFPFPFPEPVWGGGGGKEGGLMETDCTRNNLSSFRGGAWVFVF